MQTSVAGTDTDFELTPSRVEIFIARNPTKSPATGRKSAVSLQLLTPSIARLVVCHWSSKLYCETVKNVTVSLPDEVYRKARIKAAERNVSLSSLVRRFLESLAEEEGEFKRLERLQEESYAKIDRFTASDRVKREELYRNFR
jgi:hypothetical protein